MSPQAISTRGAAVEFIENELVRLLPPDGVSETMQHICRVVREVDEEIDRILRDPFVSEAWEYDGRCFVARESFGLQVAFDGLNILQWLNTNLHWFFRSVPPNVGRKLLGKELETFLWLARVRRINCEEEGQLSVLSREMVQAVVEDVSERRRQAQASTTFPISNGEQAFFRVYEEEMKNWAA